MSVRQSLKRQGAWTFSRKFSESEVKMCVHCYVKYDYTYKPSSWLAGLIITSYVGGLRNFWPRRRRGEGNPAPWIIITPENRSWGIQVDANPFLMRRWRWEPKIGFWQIGCLLIAWRP